MYSLYSFLVCPLHCKVDDRDSIISAGICSLSGSFCNSYCHNTCKPVTVGAKQEVFWTMENVFQLMWIHNYVKLLNSFYSISKF